MTVDATGAGILPTLHVPFRDYDELLKENKRLREAAEKTVSYWRRNSATNLQYDKLGDYVRLLEQALDTERGS